MKCECSTKYGKIFGWKDLKCIKCGGDVTFYDPCKNFPDRIRLFYNTTDIDLEFETELKKVFKGLNYTETGSGYRIDKQERDITFEKNK